MTPTERANRFDVSNEVMGNPQSIDAQRDSAIASCSGPAARRAPRCSLSACQTEGCCTMATISIPKRPRQATGHEFVTTRPSESPAADLVAGLLASDEADVRRALIERCALGPGELQEAVLALVAEAERNLGIDLPRMQRICADASLLADRSGDPFLRAMAMLRSADVARAMGRHAEACAGFDAAAAIFRRIGRPVEAARTRIGWVMAASQLGRSEEALLVARTARRVLLAHGEHLRAANLYVSTELTQVDRGRYRSALRAFDAALKLFESLGDAGNVGAARCLHNRGIALTRAGRHQAARAELELARTSYERIGETAGSVRVLRSIGEHELVLGRYAAALRAFEAARAVHRHMAVAIGLPLARDIAGCYLALNRPAAALQALRGDDRDAAGLESAQDALAVATRRIAAYLMLGDQDAAHGALTEAELRLPAGALQHRTWLDEQRAPLSLRDGGAEEAHTHAPTAVGLARAGGMQAVVAAALLTQATALLALGEHAGAGRCDARALRLARAEDVSPLSHRAYAQLGALAEAQGRPQLARRRYAEATDHLEREPQGVIFEF
jgi:tetratricopeptide (TPR) repeat protein